MDETYRMVGGALMLVAAALVIASLGAERIVALGTSVPTLALAVVTYLFGVLAIAPVHLRGGNHRRLGGNVLLGVGVLLFAWSTVNGPDGASVVGLVVLLAAGVLLYLDDSSEEPSVVEGERGGDGVEETDATTTSDAEA